MKRSFGIMFAVVIVVFVSGSFAASKQQEEKKQDPAKLTEAAVEDDFVPIDNMHHFMEYISQPSYKALKAAFAGKAPENRKGWKPIKSHALILAETSALIAQRAPEKATDDQVKEWKAISLKVYQSGKALYKSAGDFEVAKKNYGVMVENCNRCHQVFDNGKHQLEK